MTDRRLLSMFFIAELILIFVSSNALAINRKEGPASPGWEDYFIRSVPSKTEVFKGEPFQITYYLYYHNPVIDPGQDLQLNLKDCYLEEYPVRESNSTETIQGKVFRVLALKKVLVIPQVEGDFTIPSVKRVVKIRLAADPEDFFGEERIIPKTLLSKSTEIRVKAYPAQRSKSVFSGAVGQFAVTADFVKAKKSATVLNVKITLSGNGNLRASSLILPEMPQGLDLLQVENDVQHALSETGLESKQIVSFQLVANYRGNYTIPPIKFSTFNPDKARYEDLETAAFKWPVKEGLVMPAKIDLVTGKRNNPVLYVKKRLANGEPAVSFSQFNILLIFAAACFAAGYWRITIQRSREINPHLYHFRRGKKVAFRSLKRLQRSNTHMDDDQYYKTLSEILRNYLSVKADLPVSHSLGEDLKALGLPDTVALSTTRFIEKNNAILFSAVGADVDKNASMHEIKYLIDSLDPYFR
jgi:hypothetical protein